MKKNELINLIRECVVEVLESKKDTDELKKLTEVTKLPRQLLLDIKEALKEEIKNLIRVYHDKPLSRDLGRETDPITPVFKKLNIKFKRDSEYASLGYYSHKTDTIILNTSYAYFQSLMNDITYEYAFNKIVGVIGHELVHKHQFSKPMAAGIDPKRMSGMDHSKQDRAWYGYDLKKGEYPKYYNQKIEIEAFAWNIVYEWMTSTRFGTSTEERKKKIYSIIKNPTNYFEEHDVFYRLNSAGKKRFLKLLYFYTNNWEEENSKNS